MYDMRTYISVHMCGQRDGRTTGRRHEMLLFSCTHMGIIYIHTNISLQLYAHSIPTIFWDHFSLSVICRVKIHVCQPREERHMSIIHQPNTFLLASQQDIHISVRPHRCTSIIIIIHVCTFCTCMSVLTHVVLSYESDEGQRFVSASSPMATDRASRIDERLLLLV